MSDKLGRVGRYLFNDPEEDERDLRLCESDCPHYDYLNSCCWLITQDSEGLFTEVTIYDVCIHGIKEGDV